MLRVSNHSLKVCKMKKLMLIPILLSILMTIGCSSKKAIVTEKRDSVRTEIRYEKVFIKDTAYIEIPAQISERIIKDSISFLENDYALSNARINSDGTLFHDLRTKPQNKPVVVDTKIERRDSIIYKDREIEVPIPVERELGWWEKTSIRFFPLSLSALFLICLYLFRKPILTLIRRFI